MSSLTKQISETFLNELAQFDSVSKEQIQALKELLEEGSKLKAADLEAVFSPPEDTDL